MQNRIREQRERLGWSQERLAVAAGTSTQQISRLERSDRGLTDEWLGRLSVAMGVRKADLISDAFTSPCLAPNRGDLSEREVERTLIGIWRRLSPKTKDIVLSLADDLMDAAATDDEASRQQKS